MRINNNRVIVMFGIIASAVVISVLSSQGVLNIGDFIQTVQSFFAIFNRS